MFHSSLEWTWKWPVLSCLCIWRFLLVMFGSNTGAEDIWKVNFVESLFPIYSYLVICKVQYFLVRYFFQLRWKSCVIVASLVYFVDCSALDDSHHRELCSTPSWSWRGNDLFSLVSASGVFCLWCLGVTLGPKIYGRWILLRVFSRYTVIWSFVRSNTSLWDIFSSFDGRLVSLSPVLCKLSVALHSIIHTIVKHVPLLFGVDVEMTCSLLSLHMAFYACDVWE